MTAARALVLLAVGLALGLASTMAVGASPPLAPVVLEPEPVAATQNTRTAEDVAQGAFVDAIVKELTLEEKVGQMLFLGFGGTVMDETIARFLEEKKPGGVALFARNIKGVEQTVTLIRDVRAKDPAQRLSVAKGGIPMFVSVDQEGGNVVRIKRHATVLPSAMALGAARDEDLAFRVAAALGRDLALMGFNMNLAPVLDVNSNPKNPVIGTRSFGERPELVAQMGVAYVKGLQSEGISAVAKHFPGHGDTESDSHHALPVLLHDAARLAEIELVPFKRAFAGGLDAVMTAHIALPNVAEEEDIPATVSKNVLTKLLRQELGYDGVVITDGLEMAGIVDRYGSGEAAVRAVEAGADMVMVLWFPEKKDEVQRMLKEAVRSGRLSEARIDQSVRRILLTKARRGLFQRELLPADEAVAALKKGSWRKVVAEVASRSLTLVKNEGGVLPLQKGEALTEEGAEGARPLRVLAASTEPVFLEELKTHYPGVTSVTLGSAPTRTRADRDAARLVRMAKDHDVVVLGVLDGHTVRTVAKVKEGLKKKPVAVVSFGSPYLLSHFPTVDAYLCAFGFRSASERAAARAVVGKITPTGKLPVTLSEEHRYGDYLTYQALHDGERATRLAEGQTTLE